MIISDAYAFSIQGVFSPARSFTSAGDLVSTILQMLISAAGALGMIFIIIAGIKFVTAGGDPQKIAAAKNTILYAIIGLAVAMLAFVMVQVVQTIFGATGSSSTSVTCRRADVTGDRTVNASDFGQIARAISLPYNSRYDVNGDGVVNNADLNTAATLTGCRY